MTQKRSYASYIFWAFYAVTIVSFLSFTMFRLCMDFEFNTAASAGITAGAVLICLFIIFMLSRVLPNNIIKVPKALKVILPVVSMMTVAVVWMVYIMQNPVALTGDIFIYQDAMVTKGGYEYFVYGDHFTEGILRDVIHSCAVYLGNKEEAAVIAILLISIITIFLWYFTVKNIAGDIAAFVVTLLFFAITPVVEKVMYVSPVHVSLMILSLFTFLFSVLFKGINSNLRKIFCIVTACVILLISGMLLFDELLMLMFIVMAFMMVLIQGDKEKFGKKEFLILAPVLFVGGALIGAFIKSLLHSISFVDVLENKWSDIMARATFLPEHLWLGDYSIWMVAVLLLSCIWIACFFRCSKRLQPVYVAFVPAIVCAGLYLTGILSPQYEMVFVFIWVLVAGFSAEALLYVKVENADAEENTETLEMDETAEIIKVPETAEQVERAEIIEATGNLERIETPLPGQPLYNPLKGPKKHVKKEIKYAIEVPETLMKYDIDVPDDADYDIE